MRRVYLDYNASTPIHPAVAKEMVKAMALYGNPSSNHWFGQRAHKAVEKARKQLAMLIGCMPEEIIFTSGGTESNNYVIRGVAEALREKGNHIITSQIEHPAVLKPCQYLAQHGFEITYLPVDEYGVVSPLDVEKALKNSTILVTIMHANNEVGSIQPLAEIASITKSRKILFHTDAAQSVGKIPTKIKELGVDFMSIAGHKFYAPKGIGAVYVKKGIKLPSLLLGAGHENGRRAGTENVIEIVGLGKAAEIVRRNRHKNYRRMKKLRDRLYQGLENNGIKLKLNGHPTLRLPNTLNVSFSGIDSQKLLEKLPSLAVSTGSACHAHAKTPSAVLTAMGINAEDAFGAVRFSLGWWTTPQDIKETIGLIKRVINDHSEKIKKNHLQDNINSQEEEKRG